MRTKRLPARYKHKVEGKFPCAGPCPSISGMKKQYWGQESITVMCGNCLYLLGYEMTGEAGFIYGTLAK